MLIYEVENSLKPTSYTKVLRNAERAFGGEEIGFYLEDLDNKTARSDTIKYTEEGINSAIQAEKNFIQTDKKNDYIQKFNLNPKQVAIVPVYARADAAQPQFTDLQLQQNKLPSYSQQVSDKRAEYAESSLEELIDMGVIKVENVKKVLEQHPNQTRNEKYTNRLIDHLIEGSGQAWTPKVILDDVVEFKKQTGLTAGKFLSQFGEIAGPVGLVCQSINGNAVRLLPLFFAENGNKPSLEEIKNQPLYIFIQVKHIN